MQTARIERDESSRHAPTLVIALLAVTIVSITIAAAAARAAPAPELIWSLSTGLELPQASLEDRAGRPYLYAAVKSGGVMVLDLPPGGEPREVARIPRSDLGQLDAMHLAQRRSHLYVALGDLFSSLGSKAGLAVVDVDEPTAPRVVGLWTSPTKIRGSAHVVVAGHYAYLAAMSEGIFVLDVSDPRQPRQVGFIQPDINFPLPDPGATRHPNARGLAIRGHLLYVAYDAGGLRVVDVSDPTDPREIGKYINAAIPKKPQAYNNLVLDGPYGYVAVDYCGLEIVDLGNPEAIRQVGWWNPWACESPVNIWLNSPGHTNQLAYDEHRRLVYLSAGDSELQVVDVSDRSHPRLAASYGQPGNKRGAWGASLGEQAVYLAYIRSFVPFRSTWSGLEAVTRLPSAPATE